MNTEARQYPVPGWIGPLLILIAVILFALAAFDVDWESVNIIPLGFAFFAAGHLL